jgi:hypothetical protein
MLLQLHYLAPGVRLVTPLISGMPSSLLNQLQYAAASYHVTPPMGQVGNG